MRIALVHDYLVQYGGAERVLESFAQIFPEAPIYTLLYDSEATHGIFDKYDVRVSNLQNVPFARSHHRLFPIIMPQAIEQFDLSRFDIVLSDSSSFARGIITRPETLHISYVHTPMRYAWDDCQKYTKDFGFPQLIKRAVPFAMNAIRLWDYACADRVDHYIANSDFVARRIKKYYHKDVTVINPPVDIAHFQYHDDLIDPELQAQNYFLMVGRLISYKRHDIAIRACNKLKLPLKIIGRGPELAQLQKIAGPTIEFCHRIEDDELVKYYANARAFIFPQEEDFGIVAIEAMAAGRPLVAFRGGDIADHMTEGVQGIFFDNQTPEALVAALQKFHSMHFDPHPSCC
jgi:glycosyltransferase involved in cell wall biosynthesis